jgi:hypothetical protein
LTGIAINRPFTRLKAVEYEALLLSKICSGSRRKWTGSDDLMHGQRCRNRKPMRAVCGEAETCLFVGSAVQPPQWPQAFRSDRLERRLPSWSGYYAPTIGCKRLSSSGVSGNLVTVAIFDAQFPETPHIIPNSQYRSRPVHQGLVRFPVKVDAIRNLGDSRTRFVTPKPAEEFFLRSLCYPTFFEWCAAVRQVPTRCRTLK